MKSFLVSRTSHTQRVVLILLTLLSAPITLVAAAPEIAISVDRSRPQRGEVVEIKIQSDSQLPVHAVLLMPTIGVKNLQLARLPGLQNTSQVRVAIGNAEPEGLYVVHVWTGDATNPTSVGKATFLLGRLITDFFIPAYLDTTKPAADLQSYLKDFRSIGGNFLIAHNLITTNKAYYPSKIVRTDVTPGSPNDLVELTLSAADKQALPVLLSVSWDMTKQSPYKDRMSEIRAIATELYGLYKHHPSLAGFYSYQEGSGTYYAAFVREFSQYIKSLNPHLLAACAPHVDDPLLAGYLSTVEELDIIIYQAGVMASYRTDNRKMYPFRRVKDFCSLGAGAKRLQNKIAINHVELFGYLENRLSPDTTATTYNNIHQQILSAATVTGADGISFFTYHAHVFEASKKLAQVERSRAAVIDGIKAFDLITTNVSNSANALSVYFPYSDWIIERWTNFFLPALDAFRVLGEPVDVLPYAPPLDESVYPYYPFHANTDVLARLLGERTVLILPNVSGFQQTDSDLIKAFVEKGGVVVAFGPQIPMGRSYERAELFGIEERPVSASAVHNLIVVESPIGARAQAKSRFSVPTEPAVVWRLHTARLIARFEDGSPAVTVNKFGKGAAIAVVTNASTAAQRMPQLTRDLLDYARSLRGDVSPVDIIGSNEKTDMAVAKTAQGFRVAFVNHDTRDLSVQFRPVNPGAGKAAWTDLANGRALDTVGESLKLIIPASGFRVLEFRRHEGSHFDHD